MEKLIFILFLFFLLPMPLWAAEIPAWNGSYASCFELMARIEPEEVGVGKVNIKEVDDMVFIQDNKYLLNRFYDREEWQYLDYLVLSVSGAGDDYSSKTAYLNDNNTATVFDFDVFSQETPELVVDLGSIQSANSLQFRLAYTGEYSPVYYIAQDNAKYAEVKDPEDFSFRYLKIVFNNNNLTARTELAIKELNFIKRGNKAQLVEFKSIAPVNVYARYACKNNPIIKITSDISLASRDVSFNINAVTPNYDVELGTNPAYDDDFDNDGHLNSQDNCPYTANIDQADSDGDLIGDVCDLVSGTKNYYDKDSDNDRIADSIDNCPSVYNPRQQDSNADKRGDLCSDDDNDGIIGRKDNCVYVYNPDQEDINVNGVGDACEFDKDDDGVFDAVDNCISIPNADQADSDKDTIGDACDNCDIYNPRQADKNNNGKGDACEKQEKYIEDNDKDDDTILDYLDNCPEVANKNQLDEDKDGIGDQCDNCLGLQNPAQEDKNENGVGDKCEDVDNDGIVSYIDNCPEHANKDQADQDNDGIGDVCEDDDRDGIPAAEDNCEFKRNKDQSDVDNDGIGDVCDDKDDRFIESNKELFIGFIVLVTLVFAVLIVLMVRRIGKEEESDKKHEDKKNYGVQDTEKENIED